MRQTFRPATKRPGLATAALVMAALVAACSLPALVSPARATELIREDSLPNRGIGVYNRNDIRWRAKAIADPDLPTFADRVWTGPDLWQSEYGKLLDFSSDLVTQYGYSSGAPFTVKKGNLQVTTGWTPNTWARSMSCPRIVHTRCLKTTKSRRFRCDCWRECEVTKSAPRFTGRARMANTRSRKVYRSELYGGNLSYRLPVPNGRYNLSLYFAETFAPFTQPGSRIFQVTMQGGQPETIDLVARAEGRFRAFVLTKSVDVTNGLIAANFGGNAKLDGVSLEKVNG